MNRLPFRMVLVAMLLPFASAVVGIAVQLAWLPDLPAEVATHWGFDGGRPVRAGLDDAGAARP